MSSDNIFIFFDKFLEKFPRLISLVSGIVFLIIFFLTILDNFLEKIILDPYVRTILYLIVILLYTFIWLYYKYRLPKNKKGKIGLILCIQTYNAKQRFNIRRIFLNRIKQILKENDLANNIEVYLLNNYQSERIGKMLDEYSDIIIDIRSKKREIKKIPKEIKRWEKIRKKINGHFFIWGDVYEANEYENKYFLNCRALVVHEPVNIKGAQDFQNEFQKIWPGNIAINEKLENLEFKFSADLIMLVAKYIIGMAALISRDPFTALKLHQILEKDFSNIKKLPSDLVEIQGVLPEIISEEYLLIARREIFIKNDLSKARKYINESKKYFPKNYGMYLLKSILEYKEKNIEEALKDVDQAELFSNKNGTWKYNKAFLLFEKGEFIEGLKIYKKIADTKFEGEYLTVAEVINFNKRLLDSEPEKLFSNFILGFLNYWKLNNFPRALSYFEQFLAQAKDDKKYTNLIEEAKIYKSDIEKIMELEK